MRFEIRLKQKLLFKILSLAVCGVLLLAGLEIAVCAVETAVPVSATSAENSAADASKTTVRTDTGVVSPALCIVAKGQDMAVAGLNGEAYPFSEDVFCRNLNLSEIEYITVTSVPAGSDGTLYLGASPVKAGQVISKGNLELLTYESASKENSKGTFTFSANGSGYDLDCNVYTLSAVNASPTLSYAPDASLAVSTHRDLSHTGKLSGYDPEGDELIYEIVSGPAGGTVRILDRKAGTYRYTPTAGYTGEDSFSYVARDCFGNYSAAKEVVLTVTKPSVSVTFSDIPDDTLKSAALTMAEHNIMSGTEVGGEVFFYPEKTVSRVDFLVMAMRAVGISDAGNCEKTIFCDDDEIPSTLRGYVGTAYSLGIVNGIFTKEGLAFCPNRAITRAEAAKILSSLMDGSEAVSKALPTPSKQAVASVTFVDGTTIPAFAEEAVYKLSALGILTAVDGAASANAALTREETAVMLTSLLTLIS